MRKAAGFTLLEVVVALGILAMLSLFTVQAIQNALKTRTKVQAQIDKTSSLRDALRIIERDVNMAFNYRDSGLELYNLTQKERKKLAEEEAKKPVKAGDPPRQPIDPAKFKEKPEKIMTHFMGAADAMNFTTVSNIRMTENSPISSQAEIGYKIKPCRRRSTQEQSSKCLWRRISNYIHEDITKNYGEETVLLENVTEFKLRYLGPGKEEEWIDVWKTGEGADDLTRNKFPYAVEVTLEMKDPNPKAKDKTLRMTTVAAVRNPNNPKPVKEQLPGAPGTPPPQTPPLGQ